MWFPILNVGRALGVIPGSHKQAEESHAEFYLDNGEKSFDRHIAKMSLQLCMSTSDNVYYFQIY